MKKMTDSTSGHGAMAGIIVFLLLFACSEGSTRIGEIVSHPRDYAGREVTVSGEVTDSFSLILIKHFRVKDATGEITVITERALPARWEKTTVTGVVKEAFSLGDRSLLVIVEGPPSRK